MTLRAVIAALVAFVLSVLGACSTAAPDSRIGVVAPDRAQFDPVGKYLTHGCGSLDCHGNAKRNLRIYGCEGLRLDPADRPQCLVTGGKDTTSAELDATYRSVVGLEPTLMRQIVNDRASPAWNPDLLTLVRKGRGEEVHKGGSPIVPGDDADRCILSWLAGNTNVDACTKAQATP